MPDKLDKLGAVFDVISSNSNDVAEVVERFGGIANFAKAAPALFRIWRTVARHVKEGSSIEDAERILYYGQQTKEKVRAFQKIYKLKEDGIVGNETWNQVEQLLKGK